MRRSGTKWPELPCRWKNEELIKLFRNKNIPAYSRRSVNLMEVPLAKKIIEILKYLAAEHDAPYGGDEMLFEILHFDFFKIPPIEIAKLSVEVAEKKYTEEKTSIRRLLNERASQPPRDLFDKGIHPNLKLAGKVIEQLISDTSNVTLQTLLENILHSAGILGLIMQSPEKIASLQVVTALFDFVKEETRRNPDLDIHGLVGNIQLMKDNDVIIPLVQVGGSEKGVNLLTAHGSKGLEFEYVFLAGSNASLWEKKRKPSGGYKFPDTMFSSRSMSGDEEELRRLFYVAITRAQKQLYITYAAFTNDNKGLEPSQFMQEIVDAHPILTKKITIDTGKMAEFQVLQFEEKGAPEIDKIEEDFITRLLSTFVMNVTALNNYLNCPLQFYFNNLIRIPAPKNENTEFGSAIHHAIQRLFEKMRESPDKQFPSKQQLIGDFSTYMHRHRESFIREAFERRMEYGAEVLSNYYEKYIYEWNKNVTIERLIRNVVVNGVPIKGKLDKLEFISEFGAPVKEVNVVDYKTGSPENAEKKLRPPHDKAPNGGDYWRQAVFYKILVDNYGQNWNAVSSEFDFVEPDKKKNYQKKKLFITPEDITTVTQQITDTWNKIQNRDFYTGCGKPDCHYCDFIKTNKLYRELHDINEEQEESTFNA